MKFLKKQVWVSAALVLMSGVGMAQTASMPSVNGEPLPAALYEQRVQMALSRGQADSVELRNAVMQDLINRQLILKEAARCDVDKDPVFVKQLAMLREDLMVELLLQKVSDPAAITEAELKTEYDRQVKALGPAQDLKEYQLHLIMLKSKEQAQAVIKALQQKSGSFDKLAREKSTDPSKEQGGLVGWVLPQLVTPAVAGVMTNLSSGATSMTPIETPAGWVVIRVDSTRPYVVPGFEASRPRLVEPIVMRKRLELIQGLRQTATIKP